MKNISNIISIPLIALLSLAYTSCKKSSDNATPTTPTGTLEFHLHTNVDTNEVDVLEQIYTMTGGRRITVSTAQLYVSNIQLMQANNSLYNVTNKYFLKEQQVEPYIVGNVPAGNYTSVRYYFGLNSTENLLVPATNDTILNRPEMWFGTSPVAAQPDGYIFINFQGTIDTAKTPNSSNPLIPFSIKIGTNANYRQIIMPTQNFTITQNQTTFVHMVIHYDKLFTGVDLTNQSNLTVGYTDNSGANASAIANNIPNMVVYEVGQ